MSASEEGDRAMFGVPALLFVAGPYSPVALVFDVAHGDLHVPHRHHTEETGSVERGARDAVLGSAAR